MKSKLRFLMKKKQSFIALFVLLIMVFNACGSPGGGGPVGGITGGGNPGGGETKTNDFIPLSFYLDSDGNITETDSGRTALVANDKADVVFYSDDIETSDQRVGITFEGKTITFFFEGNKDFPLGIELSSPEVTYRGYFSSYDPVSQTYSLTIVQGGETETLPNIALSKDTFTQYKDDPNLAPSQNLRMRNLFIAMRIYKSLNDAIASDNNARFIWGLASSILKIFIPAPVVDIVVGTVQMGVGIYTGNPLTVLSGGIQLINGVTTVVNGVNQAYYEGSSNSASGTVAGVSLNKTTASLVVGASETLTATVTPSNAANTTVRWSSSNTSVATVSSNGTVTGLRTGSATITVTTSNAGKTASCVVSVSPAPVTGIPVTGVSLNKTSVSLTVGAYETLTATVTPYNATNKSVSWSSSNYNIVYISNGTVTGVSAGTATITVTTSDGGKKATCTVNVAEYATGITEFTSIAAFKAWLDAQPTNTPATAYNVKVNISDLGGSYYTSGSLGNFLYTNTNKYVKLNLSGSTFTSIENYAFYGCTNLASITIPNSVTSIGKETFANCTSLTSVTIPSSVTSLDGTFDGCTSLTSVTIPSSVTSLDGAFDGCTSLTSINIPNSVTSIGGYAFDGCTSLTSVTIPNSVTSIGDNAFDGCTSLTSINIPNSVTSIGKSAFYRSGLTSVTIPNSVTSIGDNAFGYCKSLTAITVDANNTAYSSQDDVLYSKYKTILMQYPIGKTGTFFSIPNSVTKIGWGAFADCKNLTSIIIPNSVIYISEYSFYGTRCTSITIPASVMSIGGYAFSSTKLTSVTFQGNIFSYQFGSNFTVNNIQTIVSPFDPEDLREKYLEGGIGTYTTSVNGWFGVWSKQ